MKTKNTLILALLVFAATFSACKKCPTVVDKTEKNCSIKYLSNEQQIDTNPGFNTNIHIPKDSVKVNEQYLWLQKFDDDGNFCDSIPYKADNTTHATYPSVEVFVPGSFSPNNDGTNDTFKPIVTGNLYGYKLSVFNRWGNLVFQTTDINASWNGVFNGEPLPQDNYLCRVEISFFGQTASPFFTQQKTRFITLLR